jgi:hypothetical protein
MMPAATLAKDFALRTLTLVERAKALKIVDQKSYERAAQHLLGVTALRREIEQHHGPLKRAAHAAWQRVIEAERKLLDPIAQAEAIYKRSIAGYQGEQRRVEDERRAQAEAAARRQAEKERELQIEQAEEQGADAEEIESMINEPLVVARPRVEPAFQAAKGVNVATIWKGEVTSLEKLVKAIAAGQASISLVVANEPAINGLARATRGTLQVPGVRFYNEPVVRAGKR